MALEKSICCLDLLVKIRLLLELQLDHINSGLAYWLRMYCMVSCFSFHDLLSCGFVTGSGCQLDLLTPLHTLFSFISYCVLGYWFKVVTLPVLN